MISILNEAQKCVKELSDEAIEQQIKMYRKRMNNICLKLENGTYTEDQANKNYERASRICNTFELEKNRRTQEQDRYIRQALDGMKGMTLGSYSEINYDKS